MVAADRLGVDDRGAHDRRHEDRPPAQQRRAEERGDDVVAGGRDHRLASPRGRCWKSSRRAVDDRRRRAGSGRSCGCCPRRRAGCGRAARRCRRAARSRSPRPRAATRSPRPSSASRCRAARAAAAFIVCVTVAQRRISPCSIANDGPKISLTCAEPAREVAERGAGRHHAHVVPGGEQRADHDLGAGRVTHPLAVDPVEDLHTRTLTASAGCAADCAQAHRGATIFSPTLRAGAHAGRVRSSRVPVLAQWLRFAAVGGTNTVLSWCVYALLEDAGVHYLIASGLGLRGGRGEQLPAEPPLDVPLARARRAGGGAVPRGAGRGARARRDAALPAGGRDRHPPPARAGARLPGRLGAHVRAQPALGVRGHAVSSSSGGAAGTA